jgi:short-subunit dehydrogenase
MNKYSHLMLLKRSKIKCLFLSFAIFCGTIEILSLTKFIEEASSMIGEKRQEIDVIGNTYRIRYLAQLILGMRNINSLVPVAPRIRKPSLFVECLNVILPLNYSFLLIQKISGVGILSISESRREKAELKRFFRLDAEKNHQDVSIITGGSSGLGLEFVKIGMLKKRGKVISVDKSPNPLKLEINLVHVDLDFSKPKSVNHFVKIVEKFKPNTIILNAGIGYFGETSEMNPKKAIEILNVNLIFNLMVLIKVSKLYEDWRKNVDIKIVSSSTVYFPLTKFAMYTSTKSALHAFALSMQREKSEYVNLQLIVPGGLRTGFQNKIGYVRKLDRYLLSNPEKLALKVFKDQKRNSKVIHFGFSALLFRILQRLPRSPIEKFMNFVR